MESLQKFDTKPDAEIQDKLSLQAMATYMAQLQTLGFLGYYPTPLGGVMNNWPMSLDALNNLTNRYAKDMAAEKQESLENLHTLSKLSMEYAKGFGSLPKPQPMDTFNPNEPKSMDFPCHVGLDTKDEEMDQAVDLSRKSSPFPTKEGPMCLKSNQSLTEQEEPLPEPMFIKSEDSEVLDMSVKSCKSVKGNDFSQKNNNNIDFHNNNISGIQTKSISIPGESGAPATAGIHVPGHSLWQQEEQQQPQQQQQTKSEESQGVLGARTRPFDSPPLAPSPSAPDHVPSIPGDSLTHPEDPQQRKPFQERTRYKRQTLQDMTRPLKQWLYRHRDNPYPTKSEKVTLGHDSQMTLTQVSNWFANARRRLKNTVRGPDMTWAKRVKLYNNHVEGNQELLSISSEDDFAEDSDCTPRNDSVPAPIDDMPALENMGVVAQPAEAIAPECPRSDSVPILSPRPQSTPQFRDTGYEPHVAGLVDPKTVLQTNKVQTPPSTDLHTDYVCPSPTKTPTQSHDVNTYTSDVHNTVDEHGSGAPAKFKHSILHRYLNDSFQFQSSVSELGSAPQQHSGKAFDNHRHRNPSGSLSSHDFEEMSTSSRSTPTREHQIMDDHEDEYAKFSKYWPAIENKADDDLYWKEISAALGLTTLARSRVTH